MTPANNHEVNKVTQQVIKPIDLMTLTCDSEFYRLNTVILPVCYYAHKPQ